MRAVRKLTPAPGADMVDIPVPIPGSRDILVKVKATSICGTDAHIYVWNDWAKAKINPPQTMGHEFSGEVVEVGKDVDDIKIGDYVSAETHVVCGRCYQCRTGHSDVCQDLSILGVDMDGCFAEYVNIPAVNAWKNDPSLPPDVASIQEPLGNAVHTALSADLVGKTVLITGCGPIGLLAIQVAKAAGAVAVFTSEVNDYRRDLSLRMGSDLALNPVKQDVVSEIHKVTGGLGVDVVLEMSGNNAAINQSLKALHSGGVLVALGVPDGSIAFDWGNDMVFKGITIIGVTGRELWDTWYRTRALLDSGKIDVSPVITHRMPLDEYKKGLDLMVEGNCGKVILFP